MESHLLKQNRPVAIWLLIGAFMIIVQVLLGGITRLTGSGLSITEWQPILGAFPPMNEDAWNEAFKNYQQIAQFKYINSHFTLSDFKQIYFWEWFHRDWARLMGLVFIFPFAYFVYTKRIHRGMINPMIILFLLGGLQGIIGWVMVSSGVGTELLYVSHIRLAIHFIAALILLAYVIWFAMLLMVPASAKYDNKPMRKLNGWLLILLTLQLIYGAFMAGSHAALAAPTWSSINGMWLPLQYMGTQGSWLKDLTHNLITIQFMHRNLAYLLTILVLLWTVKAYKAPKNSGIYSMRYITVLIVVVQVILGVMALLHSMLETKLIYSILHQFVGMVLLVALVISYYLSRPVKGRPM